MMQYLSDSYECLMINQEEAIPDMKKTTISKDKAMEILSEINGYQSLIKNEYSAKFISQNLGISIQCSNVANSITPYDTLLVAQHRISGNIENLNNDSLCFIEIEINAIWKVDYYSENEEILKQIDLGVLSFSDAKREAFIIGEKIPYYMYDIYYIKQ